MRRFMRTLRDNPLILPYYLPSFFLATSWGVLIPVLPLYAKDLTTSYSIIGLFLGGEAIGMLLGDVPAGLLMRRLGRKASMIMGTALAALSTAMLFAVPAIGVAIGLRILAGRGRALFQVARHAYVADAASRGVRGRTIALSGGLMRLGRLLGPLAGGFLGKAAGLDTTFLLFGAMNLVALAVIVAFVPSGRDEVASHVASKPVSLLRILKENAGILTSAGLAQTLAQVVRAGRTAIIPLYAADIVGLDVAQVGLLVSIASAVDMSLFYPAGLIMDHWGRKMAIVPSFVVQGLGMLLVPLTHSFGALLAAACLVGAANGLSSGTMMTLGADLAPREGRGEFLGIWRLIGDGGHTMGPLIVGQVSEVLALPLAAIALCIAGVGAGLLFAFGVPETGGKRRATRAATR